MDSIPLDIKPTEHKRVYDLVKLAGVDVSDWANWTRGAADAARNPKYCYEWCFVEPGKLVVLTLWLETLSVKNGTIQRTNNMKAHADAYAGMSKSKWKNRATKVDESIRIAIKESLPIRAIICEGTVAESDEDGAPGKRAVKKRLLDPVPWAVTSYDSATGEFILTRGAHPNKYVDQFEVITKGKEWPDTVEITTTQYTRDRAVRKFVLLRAKGFCELCGAKGFQMKNEQIYLETHHIVPRSEKGEDIETNIAALCPNDHKKAHFSISAESIKKKLLKKIADKYLPKKADKGDNLTIREVVGSWTQRGLEDLLQGFQHGEGKFDRYGPYFLSQGLELLCKAYLLGKDSDSFLNLSYQSGLESLEQVAKGYGHRLADLLERISETRTDSRVNFYLSKDYDGYSGKQVVKTLQMAYTECRYPLSSKQASDDFPLEDYKNLYSNPIWSSGLQKCCFDITRDLLIFINEEFSLNFDRVEIKRLFGEEHFVTRFCNLLLTQ